MTTSSLDLEVVVDNVTFPVDAEPGSDECFNVTVVEDMLLEGDETVMLEVASDDANVGNANISFKITDRDTEGILVKVSGYKFQEHGEMREGRGGDFEVHSFYLLVLNQTLAFISSFNCMFEDHHNITPTRKNSRVYRVVCGRYSLSIYSLC